MKHLSITRALIGAAASLHVRSLRFGAWRMKRQKDAAVRRTAAAQLAYDVAHTNMLAARTDRNNVRDAERAAGKAYLGFFGAASAEAEALGHTL